jgi:hypothetical protein
VAVCVIALVYLMGAYRWQEEGRLRIEGALDQELSEMIRQSSNQATRKVFARLTGTEPGPELSPEEYRDFRERRLAVKHWLVSLGIEDLHCVNPTYDGNGDLVGRDRQFIGDATVPGGLGRSALRAQPHGNDGDSARRSCSRSWRPTARSRRRIGHRPLPHAARSEGAAPPARASPEGPRGGWPRGVCQERNLGP